MPSAVNATPIPPIAPTLPYRNISKMACKVLGTAAIVAAIAAKALASQSTAPAGLGSAARFSFSAICSCGMLCLSGLAALFFALRFFFPKSTSTGGERRAAQDDSRACSASPQASQFATERTPFESPLASRPSLPRFPTFEELRSHFLKKAEEEFSASAVETGSKND